MKRKKISAPGRMFLIRYLLWCTTLVATCTAFHPSLMTPPCTSTPASSFSAAGCTTRGRRASYLPSLNPTMAMPQLSAEGSRRQLLINSASALLLVHPLEAAAYQGLNVASKKKKKSTGPSVEQKAAQAYAGAIVGRDGRALGLMLDDAVSYKSPGGGETNSREAVLQLLVQRWESDPKGSATYSDLSENTFVLKPSASKAAVRVSLTFAETAAGNLGNGVGRIKTIVEEEEAK